MFKTNPKIKQVTSCSSGDFLFVFGIDRKGLVYIWNSIECCWKPHQQVQPQADPTIGEMNVAAAKNFKVNKKK